jgi:hypothetical protein
VRYAALLIGVLALAGCRHVVVEREAVAGLNDKQWTVSHEPVPQSAPLGLAQPSGDVDLGDQLGRLEELHRNGALTDQEFEKAKQKLLDR